jgi:hypothetical protein
MRVELEALAKYIFVENVNDNYVHIEVDGIGNAHDMFCFCVELMYKGLHLLYGNDVQDGENVKHVINIDNISIEQFATFQRKMRLAGVDVSLQVIPIEDTSQAPPIRDMHTEIEMPLPPHISMSHGFPPEIELSNHHLVLTTEKSKYDISFKLIYNIPPQIK